jgi:hypothetical protein
LIERLQRQKHLRIAPEAPLDIADRINGEAHDAPEALDDVAAVNGLHRSNGHSETAVTSEPRPAAAEFPEAADSEDNGREKARRAVAIDDPDLLPIDFLEEMIAALTEAMGPMASMVVWDQVAALGETFDAFPKVRLGELIEAASREILEEPLRTRFQQIMSAGIKD